MQKTSVRQQLQSLVARVRGGEEGEGRRRGEEGREPMKRGQEQERQGEQEKSEEEKRIHRYLSTSSKFSTSSVEEEPSVQLINTLPKGICVRHASEVSACEA